MRLLGGEYTDESRMKQTDMMYGEDDDEEDDSHDGESEDEEEPDGRTQIQRTLLTSIWLVTDYVHTRLLCNS